MTIKYTVIKMFMIYNSSLDFTEYFFKKKSFLYTTYIPKYLAQ